MNTLLVRPPSPRDYLATWQAMQAFTESRDAHSTDEIWFVEHPAVFTLGRRGDPAHLRSGNGIPVIRADRGGQVTYHGPGQLVGYTLVDLRRLGIGVRDLVSGLEGAIIDLLAEAGIGAHARADAPGVYVDDRKIASLGLRVRHGRAYHGFALNVDMDLAPFDHIDPCGYPGLRVTQLRELGVNYDLETAANRLLPRLATRLGYGTVRAAPGLPDPRAMRAGHG